VASAIHSAIPGATLVSPSPQQPFDIHSYPGSTSNDDIPAFYLWRRTNLYVSRGLQSRTDKYGGRAKMHIRTQWVQIIVGLAFGHSMVPKLLSHNSTGKEPQGSEGGHRTTMSFGMAVHAS